MTATAAVAVVGVAAGCGDDADVPLVVNADKSDLEIVRFLLRLERVEEAFYAAVLGGDLLRGKERSLARTFHEHEREHVHTLEQLVRELGARPDSKLNTSFRIEDERQALDLALELEDLGADAYLAQLGRLQRESVVEKAVSIYAVEARHAGALNQLTGEAEYTPSGPFARPLAMPKALERLEAYIK